MQLTTEGLDAAIGRVRFVPTLDAASGEVMGFHRQLLADGVRTGVFAEAVWRAVRPRDFVVDLGAGTGMLAVVAARAGAGTVIGVERTAIAAQARALAAAHDARVKVVQGSSDQVRVGTDTPISITPGSALATQAPISSLRMPRVRGSTGTPPSTAACAAAAPNSAMRTWRYRHEMPFPPMIVGPPTPGRTG